MNTYFRDHISNLTAQTHHRNYHVHMTVSTDLETSFIYNISRLSQSLNFNSRRGTKDNIATIHFGCLSSLLSCLDHLHFEPCGACIETLYQDVSVFLLCIYDNVICKADVGNEPSSDADATFKVTQCLTHESLSADVKEFCAVTGEYTYPSNRCSR